MRESNAVEGRDIQNSSNSVWNQKHTGDVSIGGPFEGKTGSYGDNRNNNKFHACMDQLGATASVQAPRGMDWTPKEAEEVQSPGDERDMAVQRSDAEKEEKSQASTVQPAGAEQRWLVNEGWQQRASDQVSQRWSQWPLRGYGH